MLWHGDSNVRPKLAVMQLHTGRFPTLTFHLLSNWDDCYNWVSRHDVGLEWHDPTVCNCTCKAASEPVSRWTLYPEFVDASLHQLKTSMTASVHTIIGKTSSGGEAAKRRWDRMPNCLWLHHVRSELSRTYGGGWDGSEITSSGANCVIITLLAELGAKDIGTLCELRGRHEQIMMFCSSWKRPANCWIIKITFEVWLLSLWTTTVYNNCVSICTSS